MLSKIRPASFCASTLIRGLVIFAFVTIIPETFAQNPVLVSVSAGGSRPRVVSATTSAPAEPSSAANEIEKRAFDLTNAAREQNGLPPLIWAGDLCAVARAHSENMVRLGFFSHQAPDGSRMTDRARAGGIAHFKALGENIAYNQGFDDPGSFAVEHWLLSPGHRANILNSEFRESAIGVFAAADGKVYLTQEFISR
jgi:uncharacterized protein YkwD